MNASVRWTAAAVLVCASGSLTAQSGWKDLVGQPVPEVAAESWLNTKEKVSIDALKGKVWLIEFFATW